MGFKIGRNQLEDDSDTESSCSESKRAQFAPCSSRRERKGIELLGSPERYQIYERLVSNDTPVETVGIALDLAPEQVAFLVETLRKLKPGGKNCKKIGQKSKSRVTRVRAVRRSRPVPPASTSPSPTPLPDIGDYLIDDRTANGAGEFKGEHIHFKTDRFKDWKDVLNYLLDW